jgi:hypothetical protein
MDNNVKQSFLYSLMADFQKRLKYEQESLTVGTHAHVKMVQLMSVNPIKATVQHVVIVLCPLFVAKEISLLMEINLIQNQNGIHVHVMMAQPTNVNPTKELHVAIILCPIYVPTTQSIQ